MSDDLVVRLDNAASIAKTQWAKDMQAFEHYALELLNGWPKIRDRLKTAEAVCEFATDRYVGVLGHELLQAWRKARGETT